MKIYTKTGDEGTTSFLGGSRCEKNDPRICAYGTVDELTSLLGLAGAYLNQASDPHDLQAQILRIQHKLFDLGSYLACPEPSQFPQLPRISDSDIEVLEKEIDKMTAELPPLKNFVIPGGSLGAAALHTARTVCRRAERDTFSIAGELDSPLAMKYLNRLSDWLFMAARLANKGAHQSDILVRPK